MSTTVTLDAIYKRNYDTGSQVFTEQQNLSVYSWNKFGVSPLKPTPQGIYMPVTMAGNEAGGAINESQAFQDPGSLNPVQPQILSRLVVWPFVLTGTAIELSQTNKQAFATAIDAQQKDNMSRMFSSLNRQSLGKGTGQMALAVGAGVASTTLIVSNAIPFRRNMRLDSYVTIGGAKEINGATVMSVNYSTNTLILNIPQTWSDGSIIVTYTVQDGAPPGGKELTGLQAICDTTTYSSTFEGVSVAANPEWVGNIVDAATAPVSQDLLQRAQDRGSIVGGVKPNYLISNYGQARTFLNTELQKVRYEPAVVEGGHTVLKWNDMEWLLDKDYDINEVGMYDLKYVEKFQTRDVHLSQLNGQTLYQIVGTDKIGGYYSYYGNMGTWKRNAHTRLINLIEPTF